MGPRSRLLHQLVTAPLLLPQPDPPCFSQADLQQTAHPHTPMQSAGLQEPEQAPLLLSQADSPCFCWADSALTVFLRTPRLP